MQPNLPNRKRINIIAGIILLCVHTTVLMAGPVKDTVIAMPFGKSDRILYSLNAGTYTVVFGGKQTIKEAFAEYGGAMPGKSTDAGQRKYAVTAIRDAWGKGRLHSIEQFRDGVRIQQLFYVYPGKPFFFVQVKVYGKNVATNYISPLTASEVMIEGAGDKRGLAVPFDNDMWVRYDAQLLEKASYTSSEVTALYNNDNRRGLIIGSVEHTVWKSGIKVQYSGNDRLSVSAFGGLSDSVITHDKIMHGKVSTNDTLCSSPKIMVGMFDDWRNGIEEYARANKLAEPPVIAAREKATPMGWNSWGAIQNKINLDKAKRVVDFFSDSCKGFRNEDGTLYVDLDSFWDNMANGGINGDVSALKEFVQYCRSKNFKPGIYWAPFTDWGKHDRKVEGSTSWNYPATWTRQNGRTMDVDGALAMDPTHPATRARMVTYISRFKELGFDMIKVDFLGHAALESDRFYDRAVTTGMQAYRAGMEFLDSVLDNKMLVYAAISPTMATARYVHMRRIGCDAFSAIDNTEYTLNSTGYGWWQSSLYDYIDADHVVFNKETAGANRARLASALVTGTLITGDDFATTGAWSEAAKRLLQNKDLLSVVKDGHSFRPLEANTGNSGVVLFTKTVKGAIYLAAFNYNNTGRKYTISPARLGLKGAEWKIKELFSQASSTITGNLELDLPAADAVIYMIMR